MKKTYYNKLDSYRGILSIIILMIHLKFYLPIHLGYLAMHVFFAMSAFLIYKSLLHDQKLSSNNYQLFVLYAMKRIGRILPVYVVYLIVLLVVLLILSLFLKDLNFTKEVKSYYPLLSTFTYNFANLKYLFSGGNIEHPIIPIPHLWSISFEVQLYALVFFILLLIPKKNYITVALVFFALSYILRVISYHYWQQSGTDELLIIYTLQRIPMFQIETLFIGIILVHYPLQNEKLWRFVAAISGMLLLTFAILSSLANLKTYKITYLEAFITDSYLYNYFAIYYFDVLIAIFTFSSLGYIINFPEKIKLLENKYLKKFGEFAIVTYVFQYLFVLIALCTSFVLYKIFRKIIPFDVVTIVIISTLNIYIIYKISNFIHEKIEIPLLRLKDKWIDSYSKKNSLLPK